MQSNDSKSGDRSNLIIFPAIQWPIILSGPLGVILSSTFYYLYLNKIFKRISTEVNGSLGHLADVKHILKVIDQNQNQFPEYILLVTVILILIQVFVGLVISHRFAGPLYRMLCYLKENQNPHDLRKLKFREGDKLVEFANFFNSFLEKIGIKFKD